MACAISCASVYSRLFSVESTDDFHEVLTADEQSMEASERLPSFLSILVMRVSRYPSSKYCASSSLTLCPSDNGTLFLSTWM